MRQGRRRFFEGRHKVKDDVLLTGRRGSQVDALTLTPTLTLIFDPGSSSSMVPFDKVEHRRVGGHAVRLRLVTVEQYQSGGVAYQPDGRDAVPRPEAENVLVPLVGAGTDEERARRTAAQLCLGRRPI